MAFEMHLFTAVCVRVCMELDKYYNSPMQLSLKSPNKFHWKSTSLSKEEEVMFSPALVCTVIFINVLYVT